MPLEKLTETLQRFFVNEPSINSKLVGLVAPRSRERFPLYQGDFWQGIYSPDESHLVGNAYWAKGSGRFETHSHDFDEYGFIFSGSCIVEQKGKHPRHLSTGESWHIKTGVDHAMDWIEDTIVVIRWEPPLKNGLWTWEGNG